MKNILVSGVSTSNVGGVVGGTEKKTTTISNVTIDGLTVHGEGTQEYRVGGLIGSAGESLTISSVHIKGKTEIYSQCDTNSKCSSHGNVYVGGYIGYGNNYSITIQDSDIVGIPNQPVRILNSTPKDNAKNVAGGLIGYTSGNNNTVAVQNSELDNVYILSGDTAGGLVGYHDQKMLSVRDVAIINSVVAIPKQIDKNLRGNDNTGMLVRYSSNYITGYNILLKQCSVGYYSDWQTVATTNKPPKSSDDLLGLMNATDISSETLGLHHNDNQNELYFYAYSEGKSQDFVSKRIGRWVGYIKEVDDSNSSTGKRNCTLVSVAVDGGNLPNTDIGKASSNIDKLMVATYADYPAVTGEKSESGYPHLDINPQSVLQVQDSQTAQKIISGNAAGTMNITETSEARNVAEVILEESSSTNFGRTYCNLADTSSLLSNNNPVYLAGYHTEEGSKTTVPADKDFPILVINTNVNSEVDTQIWNFIAAMTNVASGTAAKTQVKDVGISTYYWKDDVFEEQSEEQSNSSLTYNSTTKTIRTNGKYDNTLSQITVLDVQYQDPTKSSNTFHLYVPVLVKKVMQVKVDVNILEGTNYCVQDYHQTGGKGYAAAGFNDNITALIEFNYQHTRDEWQTSLNEGENLLWRYRKKISLYDASGNLPEGTRLTLLNRQTGEVYTHSITLSDNQALLDFETVFGMDEDTPVCDLLGITATPDAASGNYVITTDKDSATVRVLNDKTGKYEFYCPKTEEDTEGLYILTVGDVIDETGYLKQGDQYYLTMCVPGGKSVVVNNFMDYGGTSLEPASGTNAPPTKIQRSGYRYCLYEGVEQASTIVQTNRVNGGNHPEGDTATSMANRDSIKITLETNLKLSDNETVKNLFATYQPKEMYQQFAINLKKYDSSGNGTDAVIGATSATWKYMVYNGDNLLEENKKMLNGEEQLILTYGGSDMPARIKEADRSGNSLKIQAVVTLYYDDIISQGFPARDNGDTNSGIGVLAESRLANRENILSITSNKKTATDTNRYYTETTSFATLTYDIRRTDEGTGRGDYNAQLGINANDPERNTQNVDTIGKYDYTNVSTDTLANAKYIRYSIELFRKQDSGSYAVTPLELKSYWTSFKADGQTFELANDVSKWENKYAFNSDASKVTSIPIQFSVLNGKNFEANGLTYANYMVRLTAELLDSENNPIDGTQASDFVIYTNARISLEVIDGTAN